MLRWDGGKRMPLGPRYTQGRGNHSRFKIADSNLVSTMPGGFGTQGEFGLVGGLLCLRFPGNAFGQMGTAAKG